MNFKDVAGELAKVAPTVAGALAGPGAATVATWVADMLGVDASPAGMVHAAKDPELAAKLRQMDLDHEAELRKMDLEARTKELSEINSTMRAELEKGTVWQTGWRPMIGWGFGFVMMAIGGAMAYNIAIDPKLAADDNFMATVVWVVVTMGGALGINVRERTKDKMTARGFEPKGFLSQIKTKD